MRNPSKKTAINWIKNLEEVKDEITKNNNKYLTNLLREKKMSHIWHPFLKENNIIYLDGGFLKWNEKIPITYKLIEKFRKHLYYYNNVKHPPKKRQIQAKLNFDMPQTPLPPKPKTRTKSYQDKMKEKVNNAKQVNKPTKQNKLGIIRRFLKWLW
jgi:hypothetical protein